MASLCGSYALTTGWCCITHHMLLWQKAPIACIVSYGQVLPLSGSYPHLRAEVLSLRGSYPLLRTQTGSHASPLALIGQCDLMALMANIMCWLSWPISYHYASLAMFSPSAQGSFGLMERRQRACAVRQCLYNDSFALLYCVCHIRLVLFILYHQWSYAISVVSESLSFCSNHLVSYVTSVPL